MERFFKHVGFMLVLLNPFLVIIYLADIVRKLSLKKFSYVLLRAGIISSVVFCIFAWIGYAFFSEILHAQFASFQIFGGIIFLMIGIRFVFQGPMAIEMLRGESKYIAGAIAMPVMIGPGTISASVLTGKNLPTLQAFGACILAVAISVLVMLFLKRIHDFVLPRNEKLIDRYIEVMGRITALIIGTVAVEMIMQGVIFWMGKAGS